MKGSGNKGCWGFRWIGAEAMRDRQPGAPRPQGSGVGGLAEAADGTARSRLRYPLKTAKRSGKRFLAVFNG